MIVTELEEQLVQVPQNGNAAGILKTAVISHIAQRSLLNRILLQLHPVVNVDAEITHENVEGDLRFRRDQNSVRIVVRMIEVEGISDAEIQTQSVELGDRPDHVESQIWRDDNIVLLV